MDGLSFMMAIYAKPMDAIQFKDSQWEAQSPQPKVRKTRIVGEGASWPWKLRVLVLCIRNSLSVMGSPAGSWSDELYTN